MDKSTKTAILALMGVLLTAFCGAAETKYVTNNLVITLRTGPGNDRKILAQPRAGTPLQIIKSGNDYTKVKTPGGTQGFVLTRFLTSKVPADIVLARLQKEHEQVVVQYEALKQQASRLDTASKDLSGDLSATRSALEELTVQHETLKRESQEFLKLKAKYQKSAKEASEARARADKVDKELQQLYSSQLNTGLLYGGGLIVIGFVVGFIVKKPKRRSPLM
jgi:SH3 domain protein